MGLAWADAPPPAPPPAAPPTAVSSGAVAAPPQYHDVVEELGSGVKVDWTTHLLTLTASGTGGGVGGDRRTLEQNARFDAGPRLLSAIASIDIDGTKGFSDLEADPALTEAMRARKDKWGVAETRYFASGKVEIDAVVSLRELLKPYTLSRARPSPDWVKAGVDESKLPTGLVLDARGVKPSPCFEVRVEDPTGAVVFDGALWQQEAPMRVPAVWAAGVAHPAVAATVGDRPLTVAVVDVSGGALVVSAADADRIRREVVGFRPVGSGAVAVVIAP